MQKIVLCLLLGAALIAGVSTAGCKGEATCSQVVDHTMTLVPAEFKDKMGDKAALVAKCEKDMTPEDRTCVLAAKSMEDLSKCK